jgi:hypothetical protein
VIVHLYSVKLTQVRFKQKLIRYDYNRK